MDSSNCHPHPATPKTTAAEKGLLLEACGGGRGETAVPHRARTRLTWWMRRSRLRYHEAAFAYVKSAPAGGHTPHACRSNDRRTSATWLCALTCVQPALTAHAGFDRVVKSLATTHPVVLFICWFKRGGYSKMFRRGVAYISGKLHMRMQVPGIVTFEPDDQVEAFLCLDGRPHPAPMLVLEQTHDKEWCLTACIVTKPKVTGLLTRPSMQPSSSKPT